MSRAAIGGGFPAAYFTFLSCLLYRFELYLEVYDVIHANREDYSSTSSKDSIWMLKLYIQYMNGVIMEAWEQCCKAAVADELGPDWRCPALDRWLRLEFYIKRHSIEDVETYLRNSGEGLNEDPFEFGRLNVYSHVLWLHVYLAQIGPNTRRPSPNGITARGTITKLLRWVKGIFVA